MLAGEFFTQAEPVWPAGTESTLNTSAVFHGEFTYAEGPLKLALTGSSICKVKLNGTTVGYGPARSPKGYARVDEWDLTSHARPGKNHLEIDVACYNVPTYYILEHPAFLQAELTNGHTILLATGTDPSANVGTDPKAGTDPKPGQHFTASPSPRLAKVARYSFQRGFTETWRLGRGTDPGAAMGTDPKTGTDPGANAGTVPAKPLKLARQPQKKLLSRGAPYPTLAVEPLKMIRTVDFQYDATVEDVPNLRGLRQGADQGFKCYNLAELDYNAPRDFNRVKLGSGERTAQTWELPAENTGFIQAKVQVTKPGILIAWFDEFARPDGSVDPQRFGCVNQITWQFTAPGEYELETFEPNALKVVQTMMISGEAQVTAVSLRTYVNPAVHHAQFDTKDADLARIFEAARSTLAQNSVDIFTDCPSRERAGWLCDSFFEGKAYHFYSGQCDVEKAFLENFAYAESFPHLPQGMVAMCYPGDHPNSVYIPNWSFWLILEIDDFFQRSHDRATVELLRPRVEGLLAFYRQYLNSDGLLENLPSWVFVEWSKANSYVNGVNYPSNMTYANTLEAAARLYGNESLREQARQVRETIRRQSYDGKWFVDHAVRDAQGRLVLQKDHRTETCQYYAFYHGTATRELYPELWRTLTTEFGPGRKASGKYPEIAPSNAFIGNILRVDLLLQAGLTDQVISELRGYYLGMANQTGTLWEHDNPSASCNHGFAGYVGTLLYRAQ